MIDETPNRIHDSYISGAEYLGMILNNSNWDRIYVVKPNGPCWHRYRESISFMKRTYGERVIVDDGNYSSFEHFLMLIQANKLIEDKHSTYSYWAGFFSNATEIHVDVLYHDVIPGDKRYVYHDELSGKYFGRESSQSVKYSMRGAIGSIPDDSHHKNSKWKGLKPTI
jgi:hypothetical protein